MFEWRPSRLSRRGLVTLGVLGGSFLAAIEATIVATAMPTVVTQLGGLAHYSWVFSAYILTSTVTVPLWGKLADLHGRRPFYTVAVVLFLAGSALCGTAQSMPQLIVFRAVQGLGAGGLLPLGMTILGDMYTLQERARTQGLFSGVWGVASIVGPLVGGYVTEHLSWRWVFFLNLPFGLAAAVLVGANLVDVARRTDARLDYRGAVLFMASISCLLIALGQTGTSDAVLGRGSLAAMYAAALLFGVLFVRVEARSAEPIVPFDLLRDPLVSAVTVSGFLVGIALFGLLSFVPLFVQGALGGSATDAGRALSPLLLGWVMMSIVTSRLLPRVGFRRLIISGIGLVCMGFAGLVGLEHTLGGRGLSVVLGLMGIGLGMTMLSLLLALQQAVPRSRLGVATSLSQFNRMVGGAVGVAVMGAIIAASLPPGGEGQPLLLEAALHRAFMVAGVFAAFALLASFRIPAGVPERRDSLHPLEGSAN